jgi:mono/diheme cytochrome c family protein
MKRLVFAACLAAAPALAAPAFAASAGPALFDANCALCHQAGGVGVPGQFPRLAGRAAAIAAAPQGRQFLMRVLLNGMSGHVTVDGADILGVMPSFAALSDADLAALLTYVSHLQKGHAAAFTASEIAAARALPPLASGAMAAEHARLLAAKVVP